MMGRRHRLGPARYHTSGAGMGVRHTVLSMFITQPAVYAQSLEDSPSRTVPRGQSLEVGEQWSSGVTVDFRRRSLS